MSTLRASRPVAVLLLAVLWPTLGLAQSAPPAGIVTQLEGKATIARPVVTQPIPLKFKDDVFFRDQVATGERSLVRVLLGGKALVTVRELSTFTIIDDPKRATVELKNGKLAVGVAKTLLGHDEEIHVRTPNAIVAIRGSLLIVNCATSGGVPQCLFTALDASVPITVTPIGGTSAPMALGSNQSVGVSGSGTTTIVGPVQNITPDVARREAQTASAAPGGDQTLTSPMAGEISQAKFQQATALATLIAPPPTSTTQPPPPSDSSLTSATQTQLLQESGSTLNATSQTVVSSTPPPPSTASLGVNAASASQAESQSGSSGNTPGTGGAPPPPPPPLTGKGVNVVVNPGFETGIFPPGWNLSGAGAVIKNIGPIAAPEGQFMAILHTGPGAVGGTTSRLSQSGLDGSGSLFSVQVTYNFLSNEWPTQPLFFNDTFVATVTDRGGVTTEVARAERATAPFQATPTTISGGGFTLLFQGNQGNGIAGWKTSSKMVSTESGGLDKIAFEIFDVGDTGVDSAVLLDAVVVALDPPLYFLQGGATLRRTGLDPLIDFRGGTETFDSAMVIGAGSRVSLAGPLLRASGTDLNVGFSLLSVLPGGSFVSSTTDPLVSLQGGTHVLSSSIGIFDLAGSRTALDAETGLTLATDKPLSTGGTLFQADGATVNTQQAVKVDTALLEATASLIALLNGSTMTSAADAIDLTGRSKVTGAGSLVALDNSRLTVSRGALVNVAGGSYLRVAGDLVSLRNGSVLNILNGALLYVSGGSIVSISGALVAFGGTGGSILSVSNNLCGGACVLIGGIPVGFSGGATAANVSIGAGAIKNPSLGTIKLASPSTALVSVSGAASKVTIGPK